ncbi:hypothetical protein [Haloarcula amylolytica]|uniref:Uncharacterized protein n=1 Tax=Haloarcula amylolytica JCM 13557 TaxID=1227452 RepID=M0KF09_9EURY|nr:hypothetical protein [Haloarcula amylolytica]EMA18774.1 hypothetical protein C442_14200 [Haloarcula amylolytica JCM 13557]
MTLRANERDAARVACLPLDCPEDVLSTLFGNEPAGILNDADGFETYVEHAVEQHDITPTPGYGATDIHELITFAAGCALRIRYADPLTGTKYEAREPDGSAEQRMLQRPFEQHPGLNWYDRNARRFYIASVTSFYEAMGPAMQSEIAAVLLAPPPADTATPEACRAYDGTAAETVHEQYTNRVSVTDDGDVRIPTGHVTRACQLLPKHANPIADALGDELPYLQYEHNELVIPQHHVRLKLAEYLWHGWNRIVNIADNKLSRPEIGRLIDATPGVTELLRGRFKRNNPVLTPYYGTTGTENPKRDWNLRGDDALNNKPLRINDKRLLTVVDCIRATPDLRFDDPIPIDKLWHALRSFFPAPHRPGNDIASKPALRNALRDAAHTNITLTGHSDTDESACTIPSPGFDPYYPTCRQNPWDTYRYTTAKHSHDTPPTEQHRNQRFTRTRTRPVLPQKHAPTQLTAHETIRQRTQQTAVTTPRTVSTCAVEPRVDPARVPQLTRDEIIFLTKISLAMERRLTDATLTQSMRLLRRDTDGTQLNVDEAKLIDTDWLESHDETNSVLYNVPADKRRRLGIENIAHDGYGEKTPAEKALHRKGVDHVAAALAAKDDVTRVIRYCDTWRLRNTACEQALQANDLLNTRIDVIAFNKNTPRYAAGIETESNKPEKPRRTLKKLTALTDTLETRFVAPNNTHLWTLMRQLHHPKHLNFPSFPNSDADNYSPANWRDFLTDKGILNSNFDELHTYRTLNNHKLNPDTNDRLSKIIGHA